MPPVPEEKEQCLKPLEYTPRPTADYRPQLDDGFLSGVKKAFLVIVNPWLGKLSIGGTKFFRVCPGSLKSIKTFVRVN